MLSREREFTHEDFARFHPAGSLGRKLLKVEAVMRQGDELRLAPATRHGAQLCLPQARHRGRRTGAVMLIDDDGRLCGLFTDSDLARLIEARRDDALDRPIAEVMTARAADGAASARASWMPWRCCGSHKISELPVVDAAGRPVGLLDITDLIWERFRRKRRRRGWPDNGAAGRAERM